MLTRLSIRDVVLIEALDLDFDEGLGVLTGETGAGKSILLDALGLALGDRSASGLVRQGAAQAQVTASFSPSPAALTLLGDNDLAIDAGEPLIVRRSVKADGGSRAFVNDQPVSAALLRELGSCLVEIHGQHDDRGLINPRGHRALLDSFARADIAGVAKAHSAMRDAEAALDAAVTALDTATRDREWLDHAVEELRSFAAEPGEEAILAERRAAMQRGERVAAELGDVMDIIEGSDGALSKLRQAARVLDRIAREHPTLGEALAAIDRALIEGSVAEEQLREAGRLLVYDAAVLEADETRLFDMRALARKHRVQPDDLAALTLQLAAKLDAIEAGDAGLITLQKRCVETRAAYDMAADALTATRIAAAAKLDAIEAGDAGLIALQKRCAETRAAYDMAADALTATRIAAAAKLDAAVAAELAPLKLDAARFRTVIAPLPDTAWGAAGKDRVEFEISTNPGAPFAPMIKIASGGELSRFILALKVALAEEGGAATMIFDEIDRGVGGAVASAIGERLARLSRGSQLLVVTHSPQVAARGDTHWMIAKRHDGIVTRTNVRALDAAERREEIARMLSGAEVTNEARAQAVRLLEAA